MTGMTCNISSASFSEIEHFSRSFNKKTKKITIRGLTVTKGMIIWFYVCMPTLRNS